MRSNRFGAIAVASVMAALTLHAGCGSRDSRQVASRASAPAESTQGSQPLGSEPLLVFAATSLRDVSSALATAYSRDGRSTLTFNFAGSNALAQQILASDRGDVFLSADERWADAIEDQQRSVPGTTRWFLSNTMVVIAHPASTFALDGPASLPTLTFEHLALADPESVPAGRYAKAYLESLPYRSRTAWSAVEGRVAPAADVRAALGLVAADAETVGIVYRTDVRGAAVRTLYEIPEEAMPTKVRYYALAIASRPHVDAARAFVEFLGSAEARAIFETAGFSLPPAAP